jgi:hypothetical protein
VRVSGWGGRIQGRCATGPRAAPRALCAPTTYSNSEWLTDSDLGSFITVGSIHGHLDPGGVKSLLTAAPGNSQQHQQEEGYYDVPEASKISGRVELRKLAPEPVKRVDDLNICRM